ncbi:MAG: hypothetical protein KDK33_17840 [Leptospiraceae bacterium]|nr:hypothetical protein [Leptospiraceae bacterium]
MDGVIVIVCDVQFNERDYTRFGVSEYEAQGFRVLVADCSGFLLQEMNSQYRQPGFIEEARYLVRPASHEAFQRCIEPFNNEKVKAAVFMAGAYPEADMLRVVAREIGFSILEIRLNLLPENPLPGRPLPEYGPSEIPKLTYLQHNYHALRSIASLLLQSLRRKSRSEEAADEPFLPEMIICGGSEAEICRNAEKSVRVVKAHAMDYDHYLRQRPTVTEDSIVFLDEYLPFHPDYLNGGIKSVKPEEYYGHLRILFDKLEDQMGSEVLVAAHPRSNPDVTRKWLGGRKVVGNSTLQLVAKSKLVVGHSSTSFNFAVLLYKPILPVFTEDMNIQDRKRTAVLANHLNVLPLNLSSPDFFRKRFEDLPTVDKNAYDAYKGRFIKQAGSPNKTIATIIGEALRNKDSDG